jgi:acyl-coenzyme A synthetase/AMP-(fatty) acid ligase
MLKKSNFFFKSLEKFKTRNAIITENGKYITYQELLLSSEKISNKLHAKKKLIFLLGQNNLETITGYISFINKGHSVALIDFRINEFFFKKLVKLYKPTYIFCEKNKIKIKNFYQNILKFKSYILFKRKENMENILHKDLMLLMSTSGSTGSPKFVRQSYLNVISNTQKIIKYLNIKSKDITITSLPFTYVYGLSVINSHLFSGATIVLTNKSMVEKKFWKIIEYHKVNNFSGVPYNYSIIDKISKKGLPSSLEYTTQAGGKMNHDLIKSILNTYKKHKIKFIQMYGAAEATSRMSYLKWKYADKKIGSIGKPISGGNFYLINKLGKKISRKNKKGELVYKGKNVFMGYAENLKDLSLPNLNKGILKTGDIAFKDNEGFYFIEGRKNRYVKIYGARVNLAELESILLKKGIDIIMREGDENKIDIYFKNLSKKNESIKYLAKITSINQNVFVVKKVSKKNLTTNYKFKI